MMTFRRKDATVKNVIIGRAEVSCEFLLCSKQFLSTFRFIVG